ncbi:hypothetical protein MBLNU459_g2591t1 [Dothideomycetes sp. NU459]
MSNVTSSTSSWISPGAGITGGYNGNSITLKIFIAFFAGLAMYNAIELTFMIFLAFNRYRGLYFWSLLLSGLGIIPYALGFLLKFFEITQGSSKWLAVFLLTIGWYPMITGESIVLWSRLHLIVSGEKGEKILFYTKWMIIIDAIIFHIPTTVLTFGSNSNTDTHVFETGYNIMEKIQMIGFFIQEVVLSTIYITETVKILRTSLKPHTRKTMKQLILINIVIIIMDLALLGLECASLYILETLLKGVVYSIKLKLEFAILSKLVRFVGGNSNVQEGKDRRKSSVAFVSTAPMEHESEDEAIDVTDFVDFDRVDSNISHATLAPSKRKSSRLYASDLDYDLARFEHIEDIETLEERNADEAPHEKGGHH